ncbi:MAG: acyl-CoA thioesterase [Akkermansiaceae bacterium]
MKHETHRLVMTTDLNQFGFLFGGRLLSWVDEASFIAASLDHPGCRFVTIGMDEVAFRVGVSNGAILVIRCELVREGRTSVTYHVGVFCGRVRKGEGAEKAIFSTNVTFVNVNSEGGKERVLKEKG